MGTWTLHHHQAARLTTSQSNPLGQLLLMIEQLPTPAMLLDRGLQVRAINHSAAMAFACARSASEVGSVGRLAGCIHAADGACGVRTGCQRCWLSIAVIEAVDHQGWTQARELRLSVSVDGEAQLRIFLLGASPMQLGPDRLALVTLQDVSPKARTTDAERTIAGLTNLDPVELPVVVIDPTLAQMVHANPAADRLLGVSALGLAGDPCRAVDCSAQSGACPVLDLGHECDVSERQLQGEGGHQVLVQVTARPLELDGRRLVVESFQVLTEQRNRERVIKRHNERLEALIELGRRRDEGGEDVLAWALEEVIKLTHSRCGYLYMVDRQQQSLRLDAVHGAKDSEVSTHSERTVSLSEAGVWADALRLLQPVRHNAYPKISVALVAHPAGFRLQRHLSVPVIEGDRVRAVIGVGDKNKKDYDDTDVEQLALFTDTVWELLRRRQAEGRLRRSVANLRLLLRGTTEAITRAVEIRDPYTAGHQRRVSDLARALAHKLGLTGPHVDAIRIAGMLHDIGKIAVPADILTKPSRLTELEFRLLEQHPVQSFEILEHVAMPFPIHTIVRQHHERLDGSGYPDGLKGKAICPEARILAVADVMEAMVSHRPYRPAHSVDDALAELRRQRGVALDKRVVAACIHLFEKDGYNFRE
jgi:putative nucleotidyltransferase with HDIG domain